MQSSPFLGIMQVAVTKVLGSRKFYVQITGEQKVAALKQQLASLSLQEAHVIGAFNPAKVDIVLAISVWIIPSLQKNPSISHTLHNMYDGLTSLTVREIWIGTHHAQLGSIWVDS